MGWFIFPVIVVLLLVTPFFAADTRDGADWKPAAQRGPTRRTRRTSTFSESSGALAVRRAASRAAASQHRLTRARKTGRARPVVKISGALADRAAEH
jgi:hypothetical protein